MALLFFAVATSLVNALAAQPMAWLFVVGFFGFQQSLERVHLRAVRHARALVLLSALGACCCWLPP